MTNKISPQMQAFWAKDHAPIAMGISLISAADGQAELCLTIGTQHQNGHGTGHGGVIQTLADSAAGFSANSTGAMAVTQTNTITFLSPAMVGDVLSAKAAMVAKSGRSALVDVIVSAADGRQVAMMRAQMRFITPKP